MATWNRVASGSTAGNISMNVDIGIQSVTRTSNTNVRVVYGVRFAMATSTYTYNSVAAFCPKGGNRYYAYVHKSGQHTTANTWYYANTSGSTTTGETCPFTIDIPVGITQTSASFEVGYGWDAHTPNQVGSSSISVSFPTGATAPTGLYCNISSYTETKVTLSGGYTSDGGASVSGTGYQYKTSSGNWTSFSNGSTALTPGTKYYFRYYATNSQGTSYSDGNANVTLPNYPSINSTPNFTIGNTLTIGLYNPLGRSCKVYLINASNTSEQNGNTTTGTSISGYTNATYKKLLYDGIPSAKSGTYKVRLVVSSLNRDTTITGGTYSIKNDGSEIPSFSANNWSYVANLTQLTNNNQTVINGYSQLTFTVNTPATSAYSSPIASYTYKWGSQSKNSTQGNTVSGGTGNVLEVSAIDSRQLSKPTSKTLTSGSNYVPYTSPILDYSSSYTNRKDGIGSETHLTLRGNLSVMKFGTDGVANAIHSAQYQVYDYSTSTWGNPITIPVSNFTLSSSGYFTLNNYQIHANGTSGGFTVGKRYGLKIILKDAQGLLGTLNSNTIAITDGKIARDVYQDSDGNYHTGINGMADSNYAEMIHGNVGTTGQFIKNGGSSLIKDRDVASVRNNNTTQGGAYYPVVSQKTKNGNWTIGQLSGEDILRFNYTTDANYNSNTNQSASCYITNGDTGRLLTVNRLFPIGAIYISAIPTNPGTYLGGTWEQLKNHFLFATNATSGNKGKSAVSSHTGTKVTGTKLTAAQSGVPAHNHGASSDTQGSHQHEVFVNGDGNFPLITYPGWSGGQSGRGANVQTTYNGFRTYTGWNGGHSHNITVNNNTAKDATSTHDHTVSYIEVYVWQRTA